MRILGAPVRLAVTLAALLAAPSASAQGLGTCDPARPRDGVCLHGFASAYYQYNLAEPRGGRATLRALDPRHDLLTLGDVGLDARWRLGPVSGRAALHAGLVAGTLGPVRGGASDAAWRVVQEATIAWRTPVLRGLTIEAGIWATPFTLERTEVHANWNWSASTLFAVAPYQTSGARVTAPAGEHVSLSLGVFNGWDQVVDDVTPGKSVTASVTFRDGDEFEARLLYAVGIEREATDPAGPWARHAVALSMDWRASGRLQLRADLFAGYEPGRLGDGAWVGLALFARLQLTRWLWAAARLDALHEVKPDDPRYRAILLDRVATVGSGTLTLDARPHERVSFRLEYRHDSADGPAFVSATSPDGPSPPGGFVPDASQQDTLLLGMTSWF